MTDALRARVRAAWGDEMFFAASWLAGDAGSAPGT
jgi:hypothetical protein